MYGGEITGHQGWIASPLYPHNYPNNVDYAWVVTTEIGMRIKVDFIRIELETATTGSCTYDFVTVCTFILVHTHTHTHIFRTHAGTCMHPSRPYTHTHTHTHIQNTYTHAHTCAHMQKEEREWDYSHLIY